MNETPMPGRPALRSTARPADATLTPPAAPAVAPVAAEHDDVSGYAADAHTTAVLDSDALRARNALLQAIANAAQPPSGGLADRRGVTSGGEATRLLELSQAWLLLVQPTNPTEPADMGMPHDQNPAG